MNFACWRNSLECCKILVSLGANALVVSARGNNCLHKAAECASSDLVKFLLDSLQQNTREHLLSSHNSNGLTPMAVAVSSFNNAVAVLLAPWSDLNTVDHNGFTLMHRVACYDLLSLFFLVKTPENIEASSCTGTTPLFMAVKLNNVRMCELLLDNGASVNACDSNGVTPLHCAVSCGHHCIAYLLIGRKANVNTRCQRTLLTPLHLAVALQNQTLVIALLKSGADPFARSKDGSCALHFAARLPHSRLVRNIVPFVWNIEPRTNDGLTPLHIAAQFGSLANISMLVAFQARVDTVSNEGLFPLLWAVANNEILACKLLLDCGAPINQCDYTGRTALHFACAHKRLEIVRFLLSRHPDLNCRSRDGSTPLIVACALGAHVIVNLLCDAGASLFAKNNWDMTAMQLSDDATRNLLKCALLCALVRSLCVCLRLFADLLCVSDASTYVTLITSLLVCLFACLLVCSQMLGTLALAPLWQCR